MHMGQTVDCADGRILGNGSSLHIPSSPVAPFCDKAAEGGGHGNLPREEAEVMCKKSNLPERRPLRTVPPGENQGRE